MKASGQPRRYFPGVNVGGFGIACTDIEVLTGQPAAEFATTCTVFNLTSGTVVD
jgi:hypothetical protein